MAGIVAVIYHAFLTKWGSIMCMDVVNSAT